jgi:hypothetical protein
MSHACFQSSTGATRILLRLAMLAAVLLALMPRGAQALPQFARQTGQNCIACHAGGQFPELTPYGRLFKLTGYTIGQRTLPLSMMGVISNSSVANTSKSDSPADDFAQNKRTIVATGSLFLAGKVTDNIGAFTQITYDNYAGQRPDGSWFGHSNADNIDLRYADRFIDEKRDLITGFSLNNNPSISDPWNTAAAWMQYAPVPSPNSSRFIDGSAPYHSFASGGNIAGLTAYAFLNKTYYVELGGYGTSRGITSFMSAGLDNASTTKLRGINPYWRLAWTHEWGANNLMIGTSGMRAKIYDDPLNTSDPTSIHNHRDLQIDAQYQYLLDPHSITAQFAYGRNRHRYPASLANQPMGNFVDAAGNALADSNAVDTTNVLRLKLTYVHQAKVGGSLGFFNLTGSTNSANQTSGFDPNLGIITSDPNLATTVASQRVFGNLSGNPGTRGFTLETFWMPLQNVRLGAQYTAYTRFNGASRNYDGFGRNARDNNSIFLYLWAAY